MARQNPLPSTLDEVMRPALTELLTVFDCDRAWLMYPCDPDSASWRIPVEVTRKGYGGAAEEGMVMPVTREYRRLFQAVLERDQPLARGEGLEQSLPDYLDRYGVRSSLVQAVRPTVGKAWLLGIHHCRQPQRYTPKQRKLFGQITSRIGITLDRELLLEQLRENERLLLERQRQLQVLAGAGRIVNTTLEDLDIRRALVSQALQLVHARAGAVGLCEEGCMVFREYCRDGEEFPIEHRFSPDEGVAGWVLAQGRSYRSDDAAGDPLVIPRVVQELGFSSLIAIPILDREGKPLGCFEIHDREDGEPFDDRDQEMLEALAAIAAVAMENSRRLGDLRSLNRRLRLLSDCNQALIRATDEKELLQELCRLVVEHGGYHACWVGLKQHDVDRTILPAAGTGFDLGCLEGIGFSWADEPPVPEPMGRVVREGIAIVSQDTRQDPDFQVWSECAREIGFRAAALLPLMTRGQILGGLCILAADTEPFPDAELRILEELAADLAFGIQTLRELRRREALELELEHQALYDDLTGLPNRRLATDRLRQALLQARREDSGGLVLFLDVDNFKRVNESHGHQVGDLLLREVGDRLRRTVRASDTVARFGGDEFLVIAPELQDDKVANALAGKMLEAFSEPVRIHQLEVYTSVSIGIASFPRDGTRPEELIRNADSALYQAKESRPGHYRFFSPELNERMTRFLEYDRGLRKALERGEFSMHYQPVLAADGTLHAAEALLRWNSPTLGPVPPDEFIPVAEENGTIVSIGYWALAQALDDFRAWRRDGLSLGRVMVNLSPRQLRDERLPERIVSLLQERGLSPEILELEITEGVLVEDPQRAKKLLCRLHDAGLRLSLDDFGTGYSSLAYLRRFPFDTLKIDRSFTADIRDDPLARRLVASIIDLGRALGLETIAEGVEAAEEAQFLGAWGCDYLQGYFFSRPLPADGLPAWYADRQPGT